VAFHYVVLDDGVGDTENGLRGCAVALPGIEYAATPPAASIDAPRKSCRRLLDFMVNSWLIVASGTGQRPLGLALVRGMTRGTDGAVGRLTCGI
jgi:hypothetical protein